MVFTDAQLAGIRANSGHCANCKLRQYPCSGPCACLDGVDVLHHQGAGYCPHPEGAKFGAGAKPAGWKHVAAAPRSVAVPESQWPLAVKALTLARRDGDRGVGDTFKRVLGSVGGDALAAAFKKLTGRECGCADRAAALNALYPYAPPVGKLPA